MTTFTFSDTVDVDFGIGSVVLQESEFTIFEGVDLYWIDDRVAEWNQASRILTIRPASHLSIAHPAANRKIGVAMPAYAKFRGENVTTIGFEGAQSSTNPGASVAGLTYLTTEVISRTPFLRATKYGATGAVLKVTDTTLDGESYEVQGIAESCSSVEP